jgi:ferredoxin
MGETWPVTIDRDECIRCAVCWTTCPEVFEEDSEGLGQIIPPYRVDGDPGKGRIPVELKDCAIDAADACPVAIIHIDA